MSRMIAYYVAHIHTFRTRVESFNPETGKVTRYRPEAVCLSGPHYFKEKAHAGPYCKQIAFANRDAGPYNWSFKVEWRGVERLRAKEDAQRGNNGHPCPRCNAMTLQGSDKDICERCSRLH